MRFTKQTGRGVWSAIGLLHASSVPRVWERREERATQKELRMSQNEETLFPPAADNLDQSSNWLVGVIDDPHMAERAVQALLNAGFNQQDILLLHGPEALKRLEAKDEQRGPLGWAHKALASVVTDASAFESDYAREASAGHSIINVHTDDAEYIERGTAVLKEHGAHYIKHFGPWTITDIQ